MTSSRMHNAIVRVFGAWFPESVDCDKVMWTQMKRHWHGCQMKPKPPTRSKKWLTDAAEDVIQCLDDSDGIRLNVWLMNMVEIWEWRQRQETWWMSTELCIRPDMSPKLVRWTHQSGIQCNFGETDSRIFCDVKLAVMSRTWLLQIWSWLWKYGIRGDDNDKTRGNKRACAF